MKISCHETGKEIRNKKMNIYQNTAFYKWFFLFEKIFSSRDIQSFVFSWNSQILKYV